MKVATLKEIEARAKTRKDGVYSYGGEYYAVKNGRVKFVANKVTREVYQFASGFMASLGKVEKTWLVKKKITELSKQPEPQEW